MDRLTLFAGGVVLVAMGFIHYSQDDLISARSCVSCATVLVFMALAQTK